MGGKLGVKSNAVHKRTASYLKSRCGLGTTSDFTVTNSLFMLKFITYDEIKVCGTCQPDVVKGVATKECKGESKGMNTQKW